MFTVCKVEFDIPDDEFYLYAGKQHIHIGMLNV